MFNMFTKTKIETNYNTKGHKNTIMLCSFKMRYVYAIKLENAKTSDKKTSYDLTSATSHK